MRRDAKTPASTKTPGRVTSRGLTVYDKIAAARERREDALAGQSAPEKPTKREQDPVKQVTTAALVDEVSPALDALVEGRVLEDPETADEPHAPAPEARRAPGSVRLWMASTFIAAVAILVVAWGSRPAGTELADVIPVSAKLPDGPDVATGVVPLPDIANGPPPPASPGADTLPPRVVFGAMPDVQVADLPPGATPPPDLSAPIETPLRDLRVVVNAPQTVTEVRLSSVVDALQSGGVSPDPRRVNLTIRRANVRYFHPEDSEAAALIAIAIGADLRDFTDFEPKPEDALIEVWLSGREVGSRREDTDPLDQLSQELRRLERGLRQALSGN